MAIIVTPEMLRTTAARLQHIIEEATAIGNGYLHNHENTMGDGTWSGGGATASFGTAGQVHSDMTKVLTGGHRLTEGLQKAASMMEHHEADSAHAFQGLFGAPAQSV